MEIAFDTAPPRRLRSASVPGVSTASLLNRIERPSLAERLGSGEGSKQPRSYVPPFSGNHNPWLCCSHIARVPSALERPGLQEAVWHQDQKLADRPARRRRRQRNWTKSWMFSWRMMAKTLQWIRRSWSPSQRLRMWKWRKGFHSDNMIYLCSLWYVRGVLIRSI